MRRPAMRLGDWQPVIKGSADAKFRESHEMFIRNRYSGHKATAAGEVKLTIVAALTAVA